jgi:hypothetical protein
LAFFNKIYNFILKFLIYILGSTGLITAVILYVLYSKSIDSIHIDPLDVIGHAIKLNGSPKRKTPDIFRFVRISNNDQIGNGDSIYTDKNSKIQIDLIDETKIYLLPGSLIRIRYKDNQIFIHLEEGEVEIELSENSKIQVSSEKEKKESTDKKKITASYKENKLSVHTDEKEIKSKRPEEIKYKIPYPSNGQIILRKEKIDVHIVPAKTCTSTCSLELKFEQEILLRLKVDKNDDLFFTIGIDKNKNGLFNWTWTDGKKVIEGSFQIYIDNKENWDRSMKKKKTIEIYN